MRKLSSVSAKERDLRILRRKDIPGDFVEEISFIFCQDCEKPMALSLKTGLAVK